MNFYVMRERPVTPGKDNRGGNVGDIDVWTHFAYLGSTNSLHVVIALGEVGVVDRREADLLGGHVFSEEPVGTLGVLLEHLVQRTALRVWFDGVGVLSLCM